MAEEKLTIANASIGIDSTGIETALTNIKTKVIGDVKGELKNKIDALVKEVEKVWVGESAEQFKTNMAADKKTIDTALDTIYNMLNNEIYRIAYEMVKADEELVAPRD